MAIEATALVQRDWDELKAALLSRQHHLKQYWRPLHQRQDYWMQMYQLLDVFQQSKPLGVARRFVSNEPRTAVDAALAILTRNPVSWRIPLIHSEDENMEERRVIGRIERTLEGLSYDLDELFSMRLQPTLWKQVAFQGLLRGMICGKFHITTDALTYRHSPLIAEIYDARLVYPHVDQWGLNQIIIERPTTLGDLMVSYPEVYADYVGRSTFDPTTSAVRIEFWSNDRGERKGMHAILGIVGLPTQAGSFVGVGNTEMLGRDARWLIPPFLHGYTPDELPVVVTPVNGAHVQHQPPLMAPLESVLQERANLWAMEAVSWYGPTSQVANVGRSILSAVEEQVPQYNEIIATIFQHFTLNTWDTLVFKTSTGELPNFQRGIGAHIPLRPSDSVESLRPQPITPDAYRLVALLQEERQKGILSNVLQAVVPNLSSGVLLQQITNAALSSLEPFGSGLQQFGIRMGTSILAQLQRAAPILSAFELQAMTPKKSFFRIEFDPKTDLDAKRHYRPVPVIKPALPDDLITRMTAARMALDPRRPIMSLISVLENILQIDDPMAEIDRISEDIAMTDPLIMMESVSQALERMNEPELAERMRDNAFRSAMVEDLRFRQMTGGQQGFAIPTPEAGPLSLNTQRTGEPRAEEGIPPEAAAAMGAIGERLRP